MRGGVTRKLLTRRKVADLTREIGLGHGGSLNTRIKEFVRPVLTNQSIHQAVRDYLAGGDRKKDIADKYGWRPSRNRRPKPKSEFMSLPLSYSPDVPLSISPTRLGVSYSRYKFAGLSSSVLSAAS